MALPSYQDRFDLNNVSVGKVAILGMWSMSGLLQALAKRQRQQLRLQVPTLWALLPQPGQREQCWGCSHRPGSFAPRYQCI